ncbi:collagenase 3-like protein [Labeo rohita]|uniref:interstitial collagenase n=1 Tax=Labeo rohita TaxID=84645 RepID=A0A498NM64_LABRO|nr:collagenase 3-like protein [Labeo rohita]
MPSETKHMSRGTLNMGIQQQLCFLASLLLVIQAAPTPPPSDKDKAIAKDYLRNFYNLKRLSNSASFSPGSSNDTTSERLKEMQKFFGLEVTGKLNKETLDVMKMPRCGVPDVAAYTTFGGSPRWETNKLTYRIVNYTPDMTRAQVDDSIARALQVWAEVSPLRFTRIIRGTADIMISFAVRGEQKTNKLFLTDHGDGLAFDGPKKTLAHAFAPGSGIGGDAHFDDDESFTFRSSRGHVLFLVAAHELGHSLGLFHSNVPGALMFPTYTFTDPDRSPLTSDDIEGIQSLYVTSFKGETVFFKDSFFWRSSSSSSAVARQINSFWSRAPDNVDAAYEDPAQDKLFLFKGTQVWAFKGQNLEPGYPKPLSSFGLPASVTKVDAAVHNQHTGKTLLFSDKYYYRYDERKNQIDEGYPRRVEDAFVGLSGEVTAAHMTNNNIYLFSGKNLFEFSSKNAKLLRLLTSDFFQVLLKMLTPTRVD